MIHQSAIVASKAQIDSTVTIGPYSVIGDNVTIGPHTVIGSHVIINGPTSIGEDNHIYHYCSIGQDPQDKKYAGEAESSLIIGHRNVIREYCTINRGTRHGGEVTKLGSENWIMAYVHIAHDCSVGDRNVFANNTTLAGHVMVHDDVILGGFTGVHQFCRIGSYCFSAISSVIVKDVPPFLMVAGNTSRPCGLNNEGLKRKGFKSEQINLLRKGYRILYRDGMMLKDALVKLEELAKDDENIAYFIDFIRNSKRGIIR